MPVEFGIWKINGAIEQIQFSTLQYEEKLEAVLERDISILDPDLMLLGRQVPTEFGKYVDLLAIDSQGNLIVIELKKDKTPRDVIAQVLDYGSWTQSLSYDAITDIYSDRHPDQPFEQAFYDRFGGNPPELLNEDHQLIIVASELDSSTERIIAYLDQYSVPVNAVFFRYFQRNGDEYLARTWLIDPNQSDIGSGQTAVQRKKEPWNKRDFYVSLGENEHRNWEDCVRYGFISAGQGRWHSRTLESLFRGARIFVNVPGEGYVGVGVVDGPVTPVTKFTVEIDGEEMPILEAPTRAPNMDENAHHPDLREYLVPVKWIKTLSTQEAIWEKGMFANQNTVCKLRNKFTLETLISKFNLDE